MDYDNPFRIDEKASLEKIKITCGWRKRKKIRMALEAITFDETTSFIKAYEKKNKWNSVFTIQVAGDSRLVKRMMILIAALGDVA